MSLTIDERRVLIKNLHHSSFKGAFLRSLTATLYVNEINYRTNVKVFRICKEHYMSIPIVIFARKNFYLLEAINKNLLQFQAAGLVEHWHSQAIDKRFLNIQPPTAPKTATFYHLSGCFYLLVLGLLVSFTIFILEISFQKALNENLIMGRS